MCFYLNAKKNALRDHDGGMVVGGQREKNGNVLYSFVPPCPLSQQLIVVVCC